MIYFRRTVAKQAGRSAIWQWRYSMRFLLALVTVVAVFCAWWGSSYRQRVRNVRALQELGAIITFAKPQSNFSPSAWIVDTIYGEEAAAVASIDLSNSIFNECEIADDQIESLLHFPELESLILRGSEATDTTVSKLAARSPQLQELRLDGTPISDNALENLSGLQSLKVLSVRNTDITNEGTTKLRVALPNCKIVSGGDYKDRGIIVLQGTSVDYSLRYSDDKTLLAE